MYDYRCKQCGALFDVLHKGKERAEDVQCPACRSNEYVRLFSAPGILIHRSQTALCGERSCPGETDCCGCAADER